jgi:hypothetical protein
LNLKYTVLWFDDRRDYLDSINQEGIEEMIREWGFEPRLILEDNPADFIAHHPFDKIDLIIVDYNLGENEPHGEKFIGDIRAQSVLTEVIFYSANPASELWDAIRAQQLEGIFVSSKEGVVAKLESVALQSLRKVLDLNNMRGLIMAEIGDLDQQIDSLLIKGYGGIDPDQQKRLFGKFGEACSNQSVSNHELIEKFKATPSVEGMIALCDSAKRWNSVQRLHRVENRIKGVDLGDYIEEVLFPRNCLAHGIPFMRGTDQVFAFRSREFVYNETTSIELRRNILRYKGIVAQLTTAL